MKIIGKSVLSRLFRNCANPQGTMGRFMLRMMNRGHRRVYAWTFDHCPLADGMRTLDIGCGGGGGILELLRRFPGIRADGVDVSEESVAMCRRRVAAAGVADPGGIVRGDAVSLPAGDGTYDGAYAIESVYFWADLGAGLREVRRVLKSGGFAAVAVECADPEACRVWTELVGRMVVRTPEQISAAFREAGFADVRVFAKGEVRSTMSGLTCVIGRKPAGGTA